MISEAEKKLAVVGLKYHNMDFIPVTAVSVFVYLSPHIAYLLIEKDRVRKKAII